MGCIALLHYNVGAEAHERERSRALRAEFIRMHPCPSTGRTTGACPGYQVDHREALICGGRDVMTNLQWLSIPDHRAKTKVEVKLCRTHRPRATQANKPAGELMR